MEFEGNFSEFSFAKRRTYQICEEYKKSNNLKQARSTGPGAL